MFLLQKIKAFGQAFSRPIIQPIIQGFLEFKALELEWFIQGFIGMVKKIHESQGRFIF